MTHPLLRRLAHLLPPIQRLSQSRDAALRERDAALEHMRRLVDQQAAEHAALLAASRAEGERAADARMERTLSMVRAEYTVLPRFGFHQPLDYDEASLPPRFDPPVMREGEPLPLPAPADRFGYPADDTAYLHMGGLDAAIVRDAIARHLGAPRDLALLDFGCSSGRVLRHFEAERSGQGWRLHGVDIQARPIEWLRLHFPESYTVTTGTVQPHLPFEDNSLDVIYGFSVFTHIKYLWDMWLLELRRVLKPGGLLVQTIHTENAWAYYHRQRNEEWVRRAHSPRMLESPTMEPDWFHHGDIAVSQAFWKAEVARRNWARYLEVLELLPPQHALSFQDVMICRKPAR
ncbi:class I SAM-dependent methyltransferase [Falsiroseomonas sp.]|uniref:class I SAM-dependent methyltransferase n=1 Tax=Falsiroseomonas sp. TaxID=2870721 RepID=UPI003F6FC8A5